MGNSNSELETKVPEHDLLEQTMARSQEKRRWAKIWRQARNLMPQWPKDENTKCSLMITRDNVWLRIVLGENHEFEDIFADDLTGDYVYEKEALSMFNPWIPFLSQIESLEWDGGNLWTFVIDDSHQFSEDFLKSSCWYYSTREHVGNGQSTWVFSRSPPPEQVHEDHTSPFVVGFYSHFHEMFDHQQFHKDAQIWERKKHRRNRDRLNLGHPPYTYQKRLDYAIKSKFSAYSNFVRNYDGDRVVYKLTHGER